MTTNEQKSEREVSEFLSHPPNKLFAYYAENPAVGRSIINWMGAKLGTITWLGKVSRPMGGKVVSIRIKAINGLTYAGKCNLSSGDYCKLRRVEPKLHSERDPSSRRGSSTSAQLNSNPLSGPRKDARDHAIAIAKAVTAARQSGEDYSVWMDKQGKFHVDQAGAAPWESTIAIAHETTGHLSYKRYENKAGTKQGLSRGTRDPKRVPSKLRRELGPIGNAIWHLPKPSPSIIYWNGPGSRLQFGLNKPGHLRPIEHPSADDTYSTLKEATAAVNRFWNA